MITKGRNGYFRIDAPFDSKDEALTTRAIIASAADSKYFPLLKGSVLSVRSFPDIADLPIVVLDVGLAENDKMWLTEQKVALIRIGWDFEHLASAGLGEVTKSQAWRPFLPKHLPNAEVYRWMDADTWIQNAQAVHVAIEYAKRTGAIVAVPEISRFYRTMFAPPLKIRSAELAIYRSCFGADVTDRLITMPLINSGFFAMAIAELLYL